MKRILIFIIFILLINVNIKANINDVSAESAILLEADSKRVLYEKNIHESHLTASIAKIMTAIIAIENGDLNGYCKVDEATTMQVGSSLYLQLNDQIKLIDALYGLMLRSGNDAAYLIAKSIGGDLDNFVLMMNNKAKELKMTGSVFNNPSGLDEESYNYSTAYDMAILMAYAMENAMFRKITGTKTYKCKSFNDNYYVFDNKHRLIQTDDNVIGGKTGYTVNAKRTLVTVFQKNGMRLITVTFKASNDFNIHKQLSEYGYENYKMVSVLSRGIIDIFEYQITPIIYKDIKYPVRNDEVMRCEIHMIRKPKEAIIGKVYLKINNDIVMVTNVYRYY